MSNWSGVLFAGGLILCSLSVRADVSVFGNFFMYGSAANVVDDSTLNPGNRGTESPHRLLVSEVRPDFSYRMDSGGEFVLRTRHWLTFEETELERPIEERRRVDATSDLTDAFFFGSVTDNLSMTVGLQNYQWGPAEIASPSNVFFHFNNDQRSFFYKEKGRVMVRLNYSPRADWTIIAIAEPTDNRERHWVYNREFKPQSALKIEKQFENPANSFALVGGEMEGLTAYVGEHFTWSPVEGTSFYADLRHQQKETHYRPVPAAGAFVRLTDENPEERWSTLGVVGFRHEARVDFRQEFILNEAGYDKDDWEAVQTAITIPSPYLVNNLLAFASPGLELRSRAYSYTSVRVPDLGESDDISVAARYLASLVQDSSALQLNYEKNVNDEMVLSAEITGFFGQRETEFTLLKRGQASVGFRYSF